MYTARKDPTAIPAVAFSTVCHRQVVRLYQNSPTGTTAKPVFAQTGSCCDSINGWENKMPTRATIPPQKAKIRFHRMFDLRLPPLGGSSPMSSRLEGTPTLLWVPTKQLSYFVGLPTLNSFHWLNICYECLKNEQHQQSDCTNQSDQILDRPPQQSFEIAFPASI